jgi:lipoprotein-anchoring transpeptidase ErfK/SrfK
MKKIVLILVVFGLLIGPGVRPAHALEGNTYIVRPGDTLIGIAVRHGVSVSELARANGLHWNSWVYVGQRLAIPGGASTAIQPSSNGGYVYIVRPGDTLMGIALRHGLRVSELAWANGLRWNSWVYVGQRLVIPGWTDTSVDLTPVQDAGGERWIDVNLATQTVTAYEGSTPVYTTLVSTGLPNTPTPVGQFSIWVKFVSDDMTGPGYYLPAVPYVMYFYGGYGLHGTYWHDNFGTPMSHGCVNLATADAEWLYNWASVGTKVVVH